MRGMQVRGPPWGYFPDLTKSILVVSLRNVQRVEAHFRGMGVCMVTLSRYISGFIGDPDSDKDWLDERLTGKKDLLEILEGVVCRHPHTEYAGRKKYFQKECAFTYRDTPDIGEALCSVEEAIQNSFLLSILQGATTKVLT